MHTGESRGIKLDPIAATILAMNVTERPNSKAPITLCLELTSASVVRLLPTKIHKVNALSVCLASMARSRFKTLTMNLKQTLSISHRGI